jgi:hypothetical protein
MKLIIEWSTPEECIEQIAQLYYLMATSNRDTLNDALTRLDQASDRAITAATTAEYPPLTEAVLHPTPAPTPAPAPAVPVAAVPVAAPPAYTIEQLSVAAVGVIDKIGVANGGREALSNMLQQQFGVRAMTELKPEQYDTFALALRQMGGDI